MQRVDTRAVRRPAPARIDCSYCVTAWSAESGEDAKPAMAEHRLLSQVMEVLLKHPTIPTDVLQGSLVDQIRPYPTGIAGAEGVKNQPEFWGTLNQPIKPSITYVVTLAMMIDDDSAELTETVQQVTVESDHPPFSANRTNPR